MHIINHIFKFMIKEYRFFFTGQHNAGLILRHHKDPALFRGVSGASLFV